MFGLDGYDVVRECACSFGCLRYCADIEVVGISVDIAGNWMEWSNKACAGDDRHKSRETVVVAIDRNKNKRISI